MQITDLVLITSWNNIILEAENSSFSPEIPRILKDTKVRNLIHLLS